MKMNFGLLVTDEDPLAPYYLRAILEKKLRPSVIIIDSKKYSSRDKIILKERTNNKFNYLDFKSVAKGLDIFHVSNHNSKCCIEIVVRNNIDILINAGTPRIIRSELLNVLNFGILNAHPGILPFYRGCTCVEWAIFNRHPVGITVHLMTEGIDEGNILGALIVDLRDAKNYVDVRIKVYEESFNFLAEMLDKIISRQLLRSDLVNQSDGKYWNVMSEDELNKVKEILQNRPYLSQHRKYFDALSIKDGELNKLFEY